MSLKKLLVIMLGSIHNIRFADRWREKEKLLREELEAWRKILEPKSNWRVRVWGMIKINKTLIPKDEQVMHTSSHIVHDTFLIRMQSQNAHRTDQFCSSACLYIMFQLAERATLMT